MKKILKGRGKGLMRLRLGAETLAVKIKKIKGDGVPSSFLLSEDVNATKMKCRFKLIDMQISINSGPYVEGGRGAPSLSYFWWSSKVLYVIFCVHTCFHKILFGIKSISHLKSFL